MPRVIQLSCWLCLAWVATMGLCSIGLHYQVDTDASESFFSSLPIEDSLKRTEIEEGLRYGFERKLVSWTAQAVQLGILVMLALSAGGRRFTAWCEGLAGGRWLLTFTLIWFAIYVLQTVATFPLSLIGLLQRWRWDTDKRDFVAWITDYMKGCGVEAALGFVPLLAVYLLIRWKPQFWWLIAGALLPFFAAAMAYLFPVLIDPVFNTFTPLAQTEWAGLEPKVRSMLAEAELDVDEILVMDASRTGGHTNAYVRGFGPSRRIVFYDNLLKMHSDDENLSVLAHEIGHWKFNHIPIGLALGCAGAFVSLVLLAWILCSLVDRSPWRLRAPSDPAGVPLVVLLTALGWWIATPILNGVSRVMERQADRYSLELAGREKEYMSVEVKMSRSNKSNVTPHPVNVFLFSTHPPVLERIEMAKGWR